MKMLRAAFVGVALLGSLATTPAFAQDSAPTPAVRSLPILLAPKTPVATATAVPVATPAPTPELSEPQDVDQFLQLLVVIAQAWQVAASLGSLAAYLFAALATTYALMFLVKSALKQNLPEHYKKILKPLLVVLTAVAAGLGYYIASVPGAIAAGAGAGGSALMHDLLDAFRYGPKKKG